MRRGEGTCGESEWRVRASARRGRRNERPYERNDNAGRPAVRGFKTLQPLVENLQRAGSGASLNTLFHNSCYGVYIYMYPFTVTTTLPPSFSRDFVRGFLLWRGIILRFWRPSVWPSKGRIIGRDFEELRGNLTRKSVGISVQGWMFFHFLLSHLYHLWIRF